MSDGLSFLGKNRGYFAYYITDFTDSFRISKTLGSTATKRKCFHFASIILRNKKKMHAARKWKICNNDNERY